MGECLVTDPRKWLHDKGIDHEVATAAGVRYDKQRDALLYPRLDAAGVTLGWKVRELSSNRQYNVPSGIPLRDSQPFVARRGTLPLCICEGETDALALASQRKWAMLKDPHIIAIPGATAFSNEWAGLYVEHDEILLFPDPDDAGEKLVQKVCGLLPRTRVVRLSKGMDLRKSLVENLGGVWDAIDAAVPVAVTVPLRRTSYSFKANPDIPKHRLVDFVVKDVRLRKRGKEYQGKCPFHKEDTPSFMVDPDKGLFYCHGCQKGGDVVSYLKERFGVGYGEAVRMAKHE